MNLEEIYVKVHQEDLRRAAEHHRLVRSVRDGHGTSWPRRVTELLMNYAERLRQTSKTEAEFVAPLPDVHVAAESRVIQLQISACCAEG